MACAWQGEKTGSFVQSLDCGERPSTLSLAFGKPVGTGVTPSDDDETPRSLTSEDSWVIRENVRS